MTHQQENSIEKKSFPTIKVALIFLTFFALFLRAAYIQNTVVIAPIRADAKQYVVYAINLINHGTFSQEYMVQNPRPDSFRSPGYPLFISAILLTTGDKYYKAVQYCQVFLGALMVPLTFLFGRFIMSESAALVGACLVALSPHLVSSTSYVLTETLFGTVFLAGAFFLSLALEKSRLSIFVLSGIFFGYAYLVNETLFFLPWFLCLAILYFSSNPEKTNILKSLTAGPFFRGLVVVLVIFSTFSGAWIMRNRISVGSGPMSSKQRALNTLTHGTYPGFIYKDPRYRYFPYREDPEAKEFAESTSSFIRIFSRRFREKPLRYLSWYILEKPYYLWSWNILQGEGDVYIYPVNKSLYRASRPANLTRIIMKGLHPVILILTLIGFFLSAKLWFFKGPRPTIPHLIVLAPILYFTLLYTVFVSWPRYSVPLRPFLYLFSIWTAQTLMGMMRNNEGTIETNST